MVALNLYCTPADIFDFLSVEGAQMRLDDHNLASGQTITVTTNAALGATALSVRALTSPLLRGSTLEFDGGGMLGVVEVVLSSTATVGSTSIATNPLPDAVNALAIASDSGVNVALAQRLVKGCRYGTSQVKLYCCSRYDDSQLQQAWSVNRWATALASRWVGRRCCRPCPKSVEIEAEEALEELKQVRVSMLNIEDIGTRTSGWPFISNVTVDIGYTYRKVRVEPQLSELTPTLYPQAIDWNAALSFEY